jgi:membrane protein DedA with SNARE-associated domain
VFNPQIQNHFSELVALTDSIKSGSYIGIFLLSMLVSYVVPLPEVVALLLFGFIGATTKLNIFFIAAIAFAGSILGNNLVYRLSFFGNTWVEKFNKKIRKHELIKYEHLVVDNIAATIYFLRLITGVRFFGPVIAGSLNVRWQKFFWADFGATLINTIFFVATSQDSKRDRRPFLKL